MKLNLSPEFYSKKREMQCPKCKRKITYTFNQLGKTVMCTHCKTKIVLQDGITPQLKKL